MALITCPECGKSNVSDTAVSCPECGYSIKEYFDREKRKKLIEEQKLQQESKRQQEIEKLKQELERKLREIDNMPYPEKPSFKQACFNSKGGGNGLSYATVVALIASLLFAYLSFRGESAGLTTLFLIVFVLLLVVWTPFWLMLCYSDYKSAVSRFESETKDWDAEKEKRKKQLVSEYEQYASNMAMYGTRNAPMPKIPSQNNKLKCPICGSTNISKISTLNRSVSVATVGLASSKIGKQYECKNCKHKW